MEEETFREFRLVRQAGKWIVSPWWLIESKSAGHKLAEAHFPHTYSPGTSSVGGTVSGPTNTNGGALKEPTTTIAPSLEDPPAIDFDSLIAADRSRRERPTAGVGYDLSGRVTKKSKEQMELATSANPRVFALSGLTPDQRSTFPRILTELGGEVLRSGSNWEPRATHLIIGSLTKSEKFLAGCASGAW